MSNPYYNHSGVPSQGAPGSSATMRAEFDAIAAGFALLPTFTAGYYVRVNLAGTALESITPGTALTAMNGLDATTAASTYLTIVTAASTYQTQAGMSAYQTVGSGLLKANNLSDVANATTSRTNLGAAASGANTDITSLNAPALGAATATTQAQFDATTKVATTAFVQTALGNLSGSTQYSNTTATLTAAQVGQALFLGGGGTNTLTLPLLSAVPNGGSILFVSQGSLGVISRQGSDNIFINGSSFTSFNIGSGDWALITRLSASNWQVSAASFMSGVGVGQTITDMTASRANATNYTNSTGKPIFVMINGIHTSGSITVGGFVMPIADTQNLFQSFLVPNGVTYRVDGWASASTVKWVEIR